MKMPSLSNRAPHSHNSSSANLSGAVGSGTDARSAVWTRSSTDDINLSQLHKFWSELSSAERRELLRIDKQALFEQVRKNFYCSRCHGLLVEGFAQIMNGKNRHAGLLAYSNGGHGGSRHASENGHSGAISAPNDDTRDPSVHSWGGLAATRDNMLTVLDCFLDGTPLEVFESARTRERERELLYPDACGGGGRGWMSQSVGSFGGSGRGHGMKETCALHTARLSCEALVDFWAALGEETRRSLLRMKEEDFIERLMFRFDSKRFCRDCRRNVLREFKEMKELKRTRKEPRCTRWFCAADTVFRYEVSDSMVHVDWRDCFAGDVGTVYQKFEWGLGTAEGKADILGFEDVGLSETVQIDGLDLSNVSSCHITVKGYKRNGLSTELAAKAHALKGQLCVHRRLIVGDGIVSITKGESIQRFFERAEETEEEEDDDTLDKDGNELDGEGSRPQKHAKSPELARDFLLDAATVIFKEQVEKAFREGTARQNAHSIFVCLALSLLEERVRVACKEITTLEKQNKLLEEEEDEKREEEERRERRKLKEKEKKLRKKEKLKVKERAKEKIKCEALSSLVTSNGHLDNMSCASEEDQECLLGSQADGDSRVSDSTSARPSSPDMVDARPSGDGSDSDSGSGKSQEGSSQTESIAEALSKRDGNGAFIIEQSKSSRRRSQLRKVQVSETSPSSSVRKSTQIAEGQVDSCNPFRDQLALSSIDRHVVPLNGKVDTSIHLFTAGLHSSKHHDSWSRTVTENQKRHDNHQQCACGSPQNGIRVKVHGQRSIGRVGSKEFGPGKCAERETIPASALRPVSRNGADLPGAAGGNVDLDGVKGNNAGLASTGPEGSREQSRREAEMVDLTMQAHTRSEKDHLPAAGGSQGGAASASPHVLCNGRSASIESSNGHAATQIAPVPSSPITGKLVWVSNNMHASPTSSGPPAVRSLVVSGVGRGSTTATVLVKTSGSSRPSTGRGRRPNGVVVPRATGTGTGPGPVVAPSSTASPPATANLSAATATATAPATVSVSPEEESSERKAGACTSEPLTHGSHPSTGTHAAATDSCSSINPKVQTSPSSSHQVASQTTGASSKSGVTSTLSTLSDPFEPESVRRQAFLKNGASTRNGVTAESKVLVEANRVRNQAHAGMSINVLQAVDGGASGQGLHAENKTMAPNSTVLPAGMVVGPSHLHCNGGPPPGNGVRPMKGMFSGCGEMLQMPCGPAQIPPLHLHPGQQSFAYYQMQGPWAPRARNGVLPLPQPGGFLVSGPSGIGMSMGGLPPMSLPMPGSLQPLPPPGMANPGHFPMPNGLNPLHLRESIFLPRYGGRSNGTSPDTRILTSAGMQAMAPLQQESMLHDEKKQGGDSGSPGPAAPTSAPMEAEKSVAAATQLNDGTGTLSSEKAGGSFSLFHFGNGVASSPADQVLEPECSSQESSSQKDKLHSVPTSSSEASIPEISRTRRCVDAHAAGTPVGEYSLFAAAPGKGFGFF